MHKDVLAWLNAGRDYTAGVELLRGNGGSAYLVAMLAKGPDAFNTTKLFKELSNIPAAPEPTAAPAAPGQSAPAPGTSKTPYVPNHNLEKQLRIKELIRQLFKEMVHLRGKLFVLPEGDAIFQVAKSIVTKDLRRQDLWQQLHYFENNGVWFDELPENQRREFDPKDSDQLEQRIKNLMASRAKDKKILKSPRSPAKTAHHKKRIADFDKEIKYLRTLRLK